MGSSCSSPGVSVQGPSPLQTAVPVLAPPQLLLPRPQPAWPVPKCWALGHRAVVGWLSARQLCQRLLISSGFYSFLWRGGLWSGNSVLLYSFRRFSSTPPHTHIFQPANSHISQGISSGASFGGSSGGSSAHLFQGISPGGRFALWAVLLGSAALGPSQACDGGLRLVCVPGDWAVFVPLEGQGHQSSMKQPLSAPAVWRRVKYHIVFVSMGFAAVLRL